MKKSKTFILLLAVIMTTIIPKAVSAQQKDSIQIIPTMDTNMPQTSSRNFGVFGQLAETVINQEHKFSLRKGYILEENYIPGIDKKLQIKICEAAVGIIGHDWIGFGCWTDFQKERHEIPEGYMFGIIIYITEYKNNEKNAIYKSEEKMVIHYLLSLK